MRTLAICLLALGTLGLASDDTGRRVTVQRDLVVAPIVHTDEHSSHASKPHHKTETKLNASRRLASDTRQSRLKHARPGRPSLLARFGRAIGITVHQR